MQERLVCKALLLKELLFEVLLIARVVVVVAILAVFLLSLATLVVLASVLTAFVFYEVYRKVNRRLSTCKVTCREELRACSFALFVCVVRRPASFLLADKTLLLPAWLESTSIVKALFAFSKCASISASISESTSCSSIAVVAAVQVVLVCDHLCRVLTRKMCLYCRS